MLPADAKPWYRTKHLVLLNLTLLVPLLSAASIGFDGKSAPYDVPERDLNLTDTSTGAMMNGLQTLGQWRAYFDNPSAPLLGAMNAIFPVGKVLGLFPATWICDRYGRKLSMWIGLFFLIGAAGLQAGSVNLAMFLISRLILGAATALVAQPAPILVAELAYPTHRAKATGMYQTFFVGGADSILVLSCLSLCWLTHNALLPSTWALSSPRGQLMEPSVWTIPGVGGFPLFCRPFFHFYSSCSFSLSLNLQGNVAWPYQAFVSNLTLPDGLLQMANRAKRVISWSVGMQVATKNPLWWITRSSRSSRVSSSRLPYSQRRVTSTSSVHQQTGNEPSSRPLSASLPSGTARPLCHTTSRSCSIPSASLKPRIRPSSMACFKSSTGLPPCLQALL